MANVRELHVNGSRRTVEAAENRSLLSVLRDDLGLTGSKFGCGEGQCGACTVLLDGKSVRSCTTKVSDVNGRKIRTIEGLESGGKLHPVQEAFLDAGALQCGYCTSGMIMSAVSLLENRPAATREEVLRHMNGNICRCGTYSRCLAAIDKAAAAMKGGAR